MNRPREPRHRYIAVEGPIGVGKTTLARRLAESYNAQIVLEAAEENPFLRRFYSNPRDAAFPTQMFFLFQRAQQMSSLAEEDLFGQPRVADYLLDKDRLFAELTLDPDELALYLASAELLRIRAPQPDLVVYLQAPVEVLQQRIAQRGRAGEELIDSDYLRRLNEAYATFFYDYKAVPLLIVNATSIDLAHNDDHYNALLDHLETINAGRHYFNPVPELM